MDVVALSLAEVLANNEQHRLMYYKRCEDYYDGKHPLHVPEKYKAMLEQGYGVRTNYCAPIVDAPVSRLKVECIQCDDEQAKEFLDACWRKNRMDAKSVKTHRAAIKKGDAFLQIWPHFPQGTLKPDGYSIKFLTPDIVFPYYADDDDESLQYVKKQWLAWGENGLPMARKDMFYPDRIERYYNDATMTYPLSDFAKTAWLPYELDGQPAVIQNPYGVIPIVHFRNKEDDSPMGTSGLHDAFHIQDGINKLIIDLMRTADFQAFRQRWIAGVTEDEIPLVDGKRVLTSNPGDVWRFDEPDVKTGEFSEGNLTQILEAIDKMVDHLCAVTRTPKSVLQDSDGTASSGFALEKVEAPLLDKVSENQVSFGSAYADLCRILMIMGAYHGDCPKADVEAWIDWKDATSESPADKLSDAQRKQILKVNNVISARQWAKEEGYTEEDINRMQEEMKIEAETSMGALIGHSMTAE